MPWFPRGLPIEKALTFLRKGLISLEPIVRFELTTY